VQQGDLGMEAWKFVFVIEQTKDSLTQLVESVTSDIPTSSLAQLHEFHKVDGNQYFGTHDHDTAVMMRAVGAKELGDIEMLALYKELGIK
jgi:hypothetical protein